GGKVWFQPPWEKAGPFWMDRKAYEFVQRMQAEGRVWSDTYGWQMPADLAQYERQRAAQRAQYTATPQAQARATRLRAQIEEEQRLAQQGHVTALDMAQLKLWVLKHAPSAQVTGDMLTLVERMTVQAQSGARVGNVEQIRQALGQELERTNQPHLSYWERYAEMEERRSTPLQDARDLSRDVTGGLATYTEIKKVPLSPRYQKLPGAVGWVANADKALQYYQGYRQQDLSRTQAAGRALLQTGVQYFVTKNPAIGLVDTGLKYGGQLTAGKDLSPSRGYEVMINALLDGRKLTASQQAASLDFSSPQMQEMIRGSQQQAVEQALASGRLSPGDREALLQLRETLHS
ncbi:MAG TPA: hypothetical protein PLB78_15790, partial [Anaerolineae bacterium]|nr:hypothetical protein [Anaerolineae bacterium]